MDGYGIVSMKEAWERYEKIRGCQELEENDVSFTPMWCPECDGTNLNEEGIVCWDCSASDYIDETSMTGWVGVYMEGAYWCECDTPTPSGNQEWAFGYPTNNLQAEMG